MTQPRVLFYVQHLVGIGHVQRCSVLVRTMLRRGLDVVVVTGGRPLPAIDFGSATVVRLPMIAAKDVATYRLVDERGRRVTPLLWWRRRRMLLQALRTFGPRALVIDMFPFGRTQFRRELIALLRAAARMNCARISSMRDIVEPKKTRRGNEQMVRLAERWFDRVLVHGDPSLIPFERSLPPAARLHAKLHYTGYVVDAVQGGGERFGVVVSAGGGALGEHLLHAALAARPLTRFHERPWRLLCGINVDAAGVDALRRAAPEGVTVETHRTDFPALLCGAEVSVSQAGYNTTTELLAARVPAVLVPFTRNGETEQSARCSALASRGLARVVPERALTPQALAAAIDAASAPPADLRIDLGGAERTAQLVDDVIIGAA